MGLDISIGVDNENEIFTLEYHSSEPDLSNGHSLSRTFCNLMCRDAVVEHETEFDQISRITGVDIEPLYLMLEYPNHEEVEFMLENAETEEERQEIIDDAEEAKLKLTNNIDSVLQTMSNLISKLNTIGNLPKQLIDTDFDSLNNAFYFADFTVDKGKGHIDNNFGQDLRNLERFLKYCKARNTKTVFFYFM